MQKLFIFTALKPREAHGRSFCTERTSLFYFTTFHNKIECICNFFLYFLCFYLEQTKNEIFYIRMRHTPFLIPKIESLYIYIYIYFFFIGKLMK